MSQNIAVFFLGISAFPVANKIATSLDAELHGKTGRVTEADVFFNDAMEHLSKLFQDGVAIVGVCASAVLIRGVAKSINDKHSEPAVVAVAEDGSAVAPLLGGHHGANDLARKIAELLGINAAITTAGDLRFGIALDEPPDGFVLANPQNVKEFSVSMLAGESVMLSSNENHSCLDSSPRSKPVIPNSAGSNKMVSPNSAGSNKMVSPNSAGSNNMVAPDYMPGFFKWIRDSSLRFSENAKLRISLTTTAISGSSEHLVYHPKSIAVGVGCERGTDPEELILLVRNALQKNTIAAESVAAVVSIDLKSDEPAIHALSNNLCGETATECPARFFDASTLEAQSPKLENPSEIVFQEVGCHGVAEGSALAAAGKSGKLIVPKIKSERTTCAIAESPELIYPKNTGKAQGTLYIVGTGPGSPKWRLPEAEEMLKEATDWVGYGLYLDLISDLLERQHPEQKCILHQFELGQEETRVRHALNLAAQGKSVALISSGDPGIYAMATLVFELLESKVVEAEKRAEWQRIRIVSTPGISAMQAAGALAGAPIGHDFCSISLSDLLTPWDTIERRISAAAEGDFVIAFYNPVSKRRTTQLADAQKTLLKHRPPETPVILAKNLGREGEKVEILTLENLDPTEADMLTLVLIGSSQSRILKLPNGVEKVYTPRGYHKKQEAEETHSVSRNINKQTSLDH
jgi:cobalt-precorrin 5A hydrolase/precorrin-3B C17-methyltransferase